MKLVLLFCLTLFVSLAKANTTVLVYNQTTNTPVVTQNVQEIRSFASITKLMTALIALESNIALDKQLKLVNKWPAVLPRKSYTREELLTAMLVRSDNAAAETLAEDYPGGRQEFLNQMNARAREIGMSNTHFDDASGLSKNNTTTAQDLQKLLLVVNQNSFIRKTSVKHQAEFESVYKKRVQKVVLENTNNSALNEFSNIVLTKTGLTSAAGWCVALVVEQRNQLYIVVILGAKTKQARLDKIKEIMYTYIID